MKNNNKKKIKTYAITKPLYKAKEKNKILMNKAFYYHQNGDLDKAIKIYEQRYYPYNQRYLTAITY